MPTTRKRLWTPRDKESVYRPKNWSPFTGKARLQVGWPDNPGNPGEVVDTDWFPNTVTNYLPWLLWTLLQPTNSTVGNRYIDGTNVYPSWGDLFDNYVPVTGGTSPFFQGTTAAITSPVPLTAQLPTGWLFNSMMAGMFVGNYTQPAPAGAISTLSQSALTTYSLVRRFVQESAAPIFTASNVFFGPAINTSTITGIGAPNPSTTLSRTFAAQTGTVNCIGFCPLTLASVVSATQISMTASQNFPQYAIAQAGGEGAAYASSSFLKTLAGAGDPFSTVPAAPIVVGVFFLASSAIVVPGGANLTVTYTFNGNL